MAGKIACHIFGCSDPVVGQCKGYKDECGRYFCRAHSPENLCLPCYDEMWKAALEVIRYARPQTPTSTPTNS
jgi:hypothetical protein